VHDPIQGAERSARAGVLEERDPVLKRAKRILQKALRVSLNAIGDRTKEPLAIVALPTQEFLRSTEYSQLMSRHLPYDGSYDLHEAQNETKNYLSRHRESAAKLGVFRWRGMQKHIETILKVVSVDGARVVDFGGAAGPMGMGSMLVDQQETDLLGRPVLFHSLADVPGTVDVIFSSHTLEHIPNLDDVLTKFAGILRPNGQLLLHLPSFSCERWRAGIHSHRTYNPHVWTFGLGSKPEGLECANYLDIAAHLKRWFLVEEADYCGDDSIFIRARPQSQPIR
jgi:SAM-dependent methyltransferase